MKYFVAKANETGHYVKENVEDFIEVILALAQDAEDRGVKWFDVEIEENDD